MEEYRPPRFVLWLAIAAFVVVTAAWFGRVYTVNKPIEALLLGRLSMSFDPFLEPWYPEKIAPGKSLRERIALRPDFTHDYALKYKILTTEILFNVWMFVSFIAAFVVADFLSAGRLCARLMRAIFRALERPAFFVGATSVLAFIGMALMSYYGMKANPNTVDEYVYVFQARTYEEGRLWNTPHPLADFFRHNHITMKEDKWVGRFPPGWPIAIMICELLRIPVWLINPLFGVLTIPVLFLIGRRMFDSKIAALGVFIVAFTPYVFFNASTLFSHTFTAFCLALFVYFGMRYLDSEKIRFAFVAGAFFGMAFLTRYFTALLCGIPFGLVLVWRLRARSWKPIAACGLAGLPFLGFLLWYNQRITGDPLLLPTAWVDPDEGLGFVKGHTPLKAVALAAYNLLDLLSWCSPFIVVAYFIYLLVVLRKRALAFTDVFLLALVVGHMFYWMGGGPRMGPRFYYEGALFAILFVTGIVFPTAQSLREGSFWRYVYVISALAGFWMIPWHAQQQHQRAVEWRDIDRVVADADVHDALVLIQWGTGVLWGLAPEELTRNGIELNGDVIYVIDLDSVRMHNQRRSGIANPPFKRHNDAIIAAFPDREVYVYKRKQGVVRGELVHLPNREYREEIASPGQPAT